MMERVSSLARENANLRMLIGNLEHEKNALAEKIRLLDNGVRARMDIDIEIRRLRFQVQKYAERLAAKEKWRKKPKENKNVQQKMETDRHAQQKKENFSQTPKEKQSQIALNKLRQEEINIEKIVADYRKGRKL